ncbi:MAG TPA: pilus assembly protein TadG-related protein [Planctomycetaceae bacterium]|nr:pilus assembly protein TadG-related protein [Planctomycetaceae bacterium]
MQGTIPPAPRPSGRRSGHIAVMALLLLIPLFACVALCVDMGWIALTKSELQNAADAGAAAGARQLVDNYAPFSLPSQRNKDRLLNEAEASALTYGMQFGGYNSAGDKQTLTIQSGDVHPGYTTSTGLFQSRRTYAGYPNTVQVMARRDASANGALPLFFAPVIGKRDKDLSATAAATIYTGLISSFNPNLIAGGTKKRTAFGEEFYNEGGGYECPLMPVAFDVNRWNAFLSNGQSPDGTVHVDAAGSPQIQVYPSPKTSPGNFGLLCLGHWTNNAPDYRTWIENGPAGDDVQTLIDNASLPVTLDKPRPWKGSPGLKSTLVTDFRAIIGTPRLLPLFKPASTSPYQAASGNGSNTTYDIVGFVGIMITEATGSGSNLSIKVQPCSVLDPTAVFDPESLCPAGEEPPSRLKAFTFATPKLTR